MEATYILTAGMDDDSFAWLDGLRRKHFPQERNFLPAHLTMFHRLSLAQTNRLNELDLPRGPLAISFDTPLTLGSGVAIRVEAVALKQLRAAARAEMGGVFSRQDSQSWRPHVTIQNKAAPEVARKLYQSLDEHFAARTGAVTGLLVWEYINPTWKLARRLTFP